MIQLNKNNYITYNAMNNIQKRFILFLLGCIGTRSLLVYLAKILDKKYLKYMGFITLIPAFGFLYLYLTDSRKSGREVFGSKIWWNELRVFHGLLYLLFSIYAIINYTVWITDVKIKNKIICSQNIKSEFWILLNLTQLKRAMPPL